MKKLLFVLFIMCATVSFAQPQNGQKRQRPDFKQIVEKRYSVIVHELELDDAKSQQLKPIYLEYCKSVGELFKPRKQMKPRNERTDEEVEADIKEDFKRAKQMVCLREKYYEKFRTVLSPRQINKIYEIEQQEQQHFRKSKKGNK